MQTRGLRNNNPLNIRHSADRWQGARVEQKDKSFVQFISMEYGYRAAWKLLESYWKRFLAEGRPFNVRNIIARWAPPNENDTQAYIGSVLRLSGLGGNEHLPQPSRRVESDKLVRLLSAMTVVECGIAYGEVDTKAIRKGLDLAFPGKRSYSRTKPESFGTLTDDDVLIWDEYRDW